MQKHKLSEAQILSIGYFSVIFMGAVLLSLPISSVNGEWTSFLDTFFTSTSAVCVTGLITHDTGTYWSLFGQIVIIILIQIGGLGFISIATIAALATREKIGLRQRLIMKEALNSDNLSGVVKLNMNVIKITLVVEFIGFLLLSAFFVPKFGLKTGLWYGLFHSISAFCNAGFDLLGNYTSITVYVDSYLLNITIMLLIIIGGIGFALIMDVIRNRFSFKKLSLHSKIALIMTMTLIIFPTIIFYFMEKDNTLAKLPLDVQVLASFFQIVSPRTAGFNSIDTASLHDASKFLQVILMCIGGSPASTAGGLKTVTFVVLILTFLSNVRNQSDVHILNKRISKEIIKNSVTLLIWGIFLMIFGSFVISAVQPEFSFIDVVYEVASAYGTVGLSVGITRQLEEVSKVVLIFIMYAGRVGGLTFLLSVSDDESKKKILYPKENVMVG